MSIGEKLGWEVEILFGLPVISSVYGSGPDLAMLMGAGLDNRIPEEGAIPLHIG